MQEMSSIATMPHHASNQTLRDKGAMPVNSHIRPMGDDKEA